jgi:hypothetical protein
MVRRMTRRGGLEEPSPEEKARRAEQAQKINKQAAEDIKMDPDDKPPAAEPWKAPAFGNWVQTGSLEQGQARAANAWAEAAKKFGNGRRRTRRRRRSRRRRGGHSDLKTRRQGMVKAVLHEARERAKAEQRRQVMERVHKKGMEMLARRKTNSATSR